MDHNQSNGNNGNRNNGQWDKWNSNASNSSYYNQPTHRPYGQAFAIASAICGLLSITSSCAAILSLPLAALGILFAILTYRKGKKINSTSAIGIGLSCIGMVIAVSTIVYSWAMLPALMQNEAFRNQVNLMTEQMYGMDFSELMQEFFGYTFD